MVSRASQPGRAQVEAIPMPANPHTCSRADTYPVGMVPRRKTEELSGLGVRMRAKRKLLGWNQRDLAERLGVSQPAISAWESERERPSGGMLLRIAAVLGESLDFLIGSDAVPRELESLVDRLADRLDADELEHLSALTDQDVDRLAALLRLVFPGNGDKRS